MLSASALRVPVFVFQGAGTAPQGREWELRLLPAHRSALPLRVSCAWGGGCTGVIARNSLGPCLSSPPTLGATWRYLAARLCGGALSSSQGSRGGGLREGLAPPPSYQASIDILPRG